MKFSNLINLFQAFSDILTFVNEVPMLKDVVVLMTIMIVLVVVYVCVKKILARKEGVPLHITYNTVIVILRSDDSGDHGHTGSKWFKRPKKDEK